VGPLGAERSARNWCCYPSLISLADKANMAQNVLLSLVGFVIVLGVLIFVHEAGHFFVAKLFRVRVLVFSFGFGKRLFGFRKGDTDTGSP